MLTLLSLGTLFRESSRPRWIGVSLRFNGKQEIPIWEVGIIRITNTASNVDNLELNFTTKHKTVLNGFTFENKFVFNVRRLLSVPKKWTGRIFIEDFDASQGVVFVEN